MRGEDGAAGYRAEREKGQSGPEELPQAERREMVLRGGGAEPEAAGYCSERERGGSGSKTCRGASAAGLFCVGVDKRGRLEIALGGKQASPCSKSCRRASAARLYCVGGEAE